jgi:hypothetical protein
MCRGFVVGGCLSLRSARSLSGTRVQMPEGGNAVFGSRTVECRHYCDINPGLSVGEDFYFLHVEDGFDHPLEEAIQAIRDFRLRPAGNAESYSVAHSDYNELQIATAAAGSMPRAPEANGHTALPVGKICFLGFGGQLIGHGGLKYNPLMVRHVNPSEVKVKAIIPEIVRRGWYIPVTDYKVGIWK